MAAQTDFSSVQYLPFARSGEQMRDFWHVPATGDYALDCALGDGLARSALAHLARYPSHNLLGDIVRDMLKHGRWSGVELGFWVVISRSLLVSLNSAEGE